jgi:hypothetical protein
MKRRHFVLGLAGLGLAGAGFLATVTWMKPWSTSSENPYQLIAAEW